MKSLKLFELSAGAGIAAAFSLLFLSASAAAFDGPWVGLVQDESEAPECIAFADAPIQAAVRNNRFYGWAQIGVNWHKVSGRIDANGKVVGRISAADALDPEAVPSRTFSQLQFSLQLDGTTAAGSWVGSGGCSGEITAYQP
jgi:hypothetical protein